MPFMIRRQKHIDAFMELYLLGENQYIALIGEKEIGKTTFLHTLEDEGLFGEKMVHWINIEDTSALDVINEENIDRNENIVIIDNNDSASFDEIRTFIESFHPNSRVIFTSQSAIENTLVSTYLLEGI